VHAPSSREARTIREAYELNLRFWSFLGPTTHMAALGLFGAIASFNPYAIWYYVVMVTIPANLFMIGLLVWTKRLDRKHRDLVA
jgi:hypothetical protein